MQPKSPSTCLRAIAVTFAAVLFLTSAWAADHESVLHNFGNGYDGFGGTSLIRDAAGNLYGRTSNGGIYPCFPGFCGTVFELSPMEGGGWTETVLHNFGNGTDGAFPSDLIRDAAGNLYGTTQSGGLHGFGIVYELSPAGGGDWTETVLYNFGDEDGPSGADGSLFRDAAGNLYGATFYSGPYREGSVYKLSPSEGGDWTKTVLHEFGSGSDGVFPNGGLVIDAAGNVYGTTGFGGIYSYGTVFELSPSAGGGWTETVLHSFNGSDGSVVETGLVMDTPGNLYGTTYQGGNLGGLVCAPFGCGTVFELSPVAGGGWTETTLYSFNGQPDAGYPQSNLILDARGNLYGTTSMGGTDNDGSAFELSHVAGGWTETVVYSFDSLDGGLDARGGMALDRAGDLYGTTPVGGIYDGGTAYELTPPSISSGAIPH